MFHDFRFVGIEHGIGKVLAREFRLGLGKGFLVVDVEFGLGLPVVLKKVFEAMLVRQKSIFWVSLLFFGL